VVSISLPLNYHHNIQAWNGEWSMESLSESTDGYNLPVLPVNEELIDYSFYNN